MTPKQKAAMQAAVDAIEAFDGFTEYYPDSYAADMANRAKPMLRAALAEPVVEPVKLWCETCEGAGKVYQEHQDGCWVGGHHTCPDCGGKGYDFTPPASEPAAHVSNNGRGYPWEHDGALTPIYSPQQLDEVIEGSASTHYAAWDSSIPSPTEGMNIVKRIHHVGGRNNAAGFVEFGSIQAVQALVRQVLRDLPMRQAKVPLLTDAEIGQCVQPFVKAALDSGVWDYAHFARAIEALVLQKAGWYDQSTVTSKDCK